MKTTTVATQIFPNGFHVSVDKKKYRVRYPSSVWKNIPDTVQQLLADSAGYFFTRHFPLLTKQKIRYMFPPPITKSFFFEGFIYSLPEVVVKTPQYGQKTSHLIKKVLDSGYAIEFSGISKTSFYPSVKENFSQKAALLFSFGKDSLLTYGVVKEIGLTPMLYFFKEPYSYFEVPNKEKLKRDFEKEEKVKIHFLQNKLGFLRQNGGEMWGWDMLLSQYTLLLLPYFLGEHIEYYFVSNEQSTNELEYDNEGFLVNVTFEQSNSWTVYLNNLLRLFSSSTQVGSILEPLQEIVIMYILHHRYPQIGKYQLSCDNEHKEAKKKRWCENCFECARVYLFLCAIGVDPHSVGFIDNMLKKEKIDHFLLFSIKESAMSKEEFIQKYADRIFAFYLAHLRGVPGDVIEIFRQKLLPMMLPYKRMLFKKYFKIYKTQTISSELTKKILPLYRSELESFVSEITAFL